MKKSYYALLTALVLFLLGSTHPVAAAERAESVDSRQGPCCITQQSMVEEYLLPSENGAKAQKRAAERDALRIMPGRENMMLMPSTGTVNMLVLPIAFPDYPDLKGSFDPQELSRQFFDPYDLALESRRVDLSVRGFYYYSSYGKLDIQGAVLPLYEAPEPSTYYLLPDTIEDIDTGKIRPLIAAALSDCIRQGLDLSKFDNDGDGILDAVVIRPLYPSHAAYTLTSAIISGAGGANIPDSTLKLCSFTWIPKMSSHSNLSYDPDFDAAARRHEIAHLLGLPDNYPTLVENPSPDYDPDKDYDVNVIPDNMRELTGTFSYKGSCAYINTYYKYLLGWLDPVVLTPEDPVNTLELFPMEGSLEKDGGPRAVVLIPEAEEFPFSEFYIAEYRAGGWYEDNPFADTSGMLFEKKYASSTGLVIWHCSTNLSFSYDRHYGNRASYLRPVLKTEGDFNTYRKSDIYTAGDVFSADTVPSSDLYSGSKTGIYLEVVSLEPEKAVLRAGFQDPPAPLSRPELSISAPSVPAVNGHGSVSFTVTATVDGKPVEINSLSELLTYGWMINIPYYSYESKNSNKIKVQKASFDKKTGLLTLNGVSGDGTLQLELPAGVAVYDGKSSAAATSAEVLVDNTPPKITLQGRVTITLAGGDPYVEYGATATDDTDPDIDSKLVIDTSQLKLDEAGLYEVIYSATDHAGNTGRAIRLVDVGPQPQAPFSIDPIEGEVHFGDPPFRLTTSGGSGTGKVVFSAKCPPFTQPISVDSDGLVHILSPGQAKVLAKKEGSTNYEPSEEAELLITVLRQSLESLTVTVSSVVYDGTAQTPAFTAKDMVNNPLGSVTPGKRTYTVSYRDNVEPGTGYVILTATDDSYYSGAKTVPFTIEKAVPEYTLPSRLTAVYGQTLSQLSLPPGFAWEEPGDTPVGEIGRRRIHKASYTPEDTRHYRTVTGLNVSLIVTSAPLTVKAENCSIAFGEEVPALGYRITGFAPGEGPELLSGAPELTTDYRPGDPMGNYPIRVSQGTLTGPANYVFSYEEGTLSVGLSRQEPLTVESCGEKTYGDAPFRLTALGGSGEGALRWQVVEGDAVTVTAEGLATVHRAGSAQVRVEKAGDTAYAPAVSEPMTITVTKAPLTVTAEDVSVDQGDTLPAFSYRVTGLVGEDRLLTPPTFACAVTDSAAAGTWPITPAGADAGENYEIRYQPGTLTVRAKETPPNPPVPPDPPVTPDPPGGGGGGGGGSSAPATYTVSLPDKIQGGKVSVSPTRAEAGKTITLTVTAEEGYTLTSLTALDGKGKAVTLTAGTEDRYTFSMPGSNVTIQAVFSKRETPPEPEEPLPLPFIDVKEGDWFAPAVRAMYERGVMAGVAEDRFGPHLPASRAMAVTILYRMEGEPEVEKAPFTDVPEEEYYARAVAWAAKEGLVNGYGDGTFRPNGDITREQLAALLYRYAAWKGWDQSARAKLEGYMDVEQVSPYAVPAMEWATAAGLINGTDWGGLAPQTETSRAELAAILERMLSAFQREG